MDNLPPFDDIIATGDEISNRLDAIREEVAASLSGDVSFGDGYISGGALKELAEKRPDEPIFLDDTYHRVYIRDHDNHRHSLHGAIAFVRQYGCYTLGRKVHAYFCSTLQGMDENGRYHRYHYQLPPDLWDEYEVDFPEQKSFSIRLPICQNCIKVMAKKAGFSFRRKSSPPEIARRGGAQQFMDCVRALHQNDDDARKKVYDFFRQCVSR